ncbi:acetyl/propionyl/methylcrotonyl-CoA carboxylase subunit alpha [Gordonia rubripertincta]|uniref:biotin carboxylase n=1 Tax=Gordonia rubripertincta TaxID=36822 RepID=A0ABT4MZM2_GORRU|nr:acetyl-CoA carboxylase biotin carboxylase subunit [Gordonia rubripertincta]MCZ4552441.1 acetyl-CoA carboxylase biotin carboxylase subunit [Gordonia rubripertincta]
MTTIKKVLIANRGEIACRVIRTLKASGIRSVAVYSDADSDALHVRLADEAVRIGPAAATESYLSIDAVIGAAQRVSADAVHPGYGFLSENSAFATALAEASIIFLGPPAKAIEVMGDKIAARAAVSERDVPVVPGISRPGLTDDELIGAASDIGFPVLIKPSAGGGGKGMHRVADPAELPAALRTARREAAAAFGDDTLFMERFVDTPRHIEVQVLADTHGNVVHLGERECSLQRRHQKVIEEAPSALLDSATRARIGAAACDAARSVGYTGAGTVEFIVSAYKPDEFFFMEMNTRLQVEHPVTELVTGIDLVDWQLRVAAGEKLDFGQDDVTMTGHAIEARVYAEDPAAGFLPTGGPLLLVDEPSGPGIRVDSGIVTGGVVGSDYDPMLAKVIVHGTDRAEAIDRLRAALADTHVLGLQTNVDFCDFVLDQPKVRAGDLDTELLDRLIVDYRPAPVPPEALALIGLHRVRQARRGDSPWTSQVGWRVGGAAPTRTRLQVGDDVVTVNVTGPETDAHVSVGDWTARASLVGERLTIDGVGARWLIAETTPTTQLEHVTDTDHTYWVSGTVAGAPGTWEVGKARILKTSGDAEALGVITSPMPGTVVAVLHAGDDAVEAGTPVLVVEAMKMEHTLTAPRSGDLTVNVGVGDKVTSGHVLATIVDDSATVDNSEGTPA